ncbi:hypothetical protein B6R96_35980 (plasmid) [Streptomyces sp. Sge12]|uniref:hypothetical protein n=1 Tax=Streptomyces sp. Sge12 TaxID=1972846 RepID=UPI0009C3CD27|nr:hypothetical protein [Streptomyces sp. Sge12]ARE79430.1 hypothetical protein B6R96_35980 [Streptomyces sp. Sge12]
MTVLEGCLWGLLGAALIEGLDLYTAIHTTDGWPWKKKGEPAFAPYAVAVIIRLGVGMGLTAAFAASGQVAGPLAALTIGIAAPKILQQLAKQGLSHPAVTAPPVEPGALVPAPGTSAHQAAAPEMTTPQGGQIGAL